MYLGPLNYQSILKSIINYLLSIKIRFLKIRIQITYCASRFFIKNILLEIRINLFTLKIFYYETKIEFDSWYFDMFVFYGM